jgi:hypothetical protein
MASMIRITRNPAMDEDGASIALAEWVDAVSRHEGVRIADGDYSVTRPETGQVFTLRNNGGDTEMFVSHVGAWQRVFRWDEEDILFIGTEAFGVDAQCQLRSMARALANALQAVVCGDDGRIYD